MERHINTAEYFTPDERDPDDARRLDAARERLEGADMSYVVGKMADANRQADERRARSR